MVSLSPSNRIDRNQHSTMAATSPSSHPHTTHYLRAIVRAHKAPSQPASSPLSVPSDGSPPPGLPPAPSELGDQDEPSSSSASSLSSSPRKASIASSTDGDSSSGGPSGRGRPAQAGGEVEGELVGKVVGLLDDEDEETLKELLRDELGLGYETKVSAFHPALCRVDIWRRTRRQGRVLWWEGPGPEGRMS